MAKINRQNVYDKYDGKCAYCGCNITLKTMQVDHIKPKWHNISEEKAIFYGIEKGSDDYDNLLPSCRRCNKWKSTFSIDQFRGEIIIQLERLDKYSPNYRLARDYGLIKETPIDVLFYFETYKPNI